MANADWVNAIATVLTFVATAIIGLIGCRLSKNQIKPFLYIEVTCRQDHTIVELKNEGLGPARITKVKYRLKIRNADKKCEKDDDDDLRVSEHSGDWDKWRVDTGRTRTPASPLAKLKLCASVSHIVKTGWKSLCTSNTSTAPTTPLDRTNTVTNSDDSTCQPVQPAATATAFSVALGDSSSSSSRNVASLQQHQGHWSDLYLLETNRVIPGLCLDSS